MKSPTSCDGHGKVIGVLFFQPEFSSSKLAMETQEQYNKSIRS